MGFIHLRRLYGQDNLLPGKFCKLDAYHQASVDIWKMEVTQKTRYYLWRVCTGTLPVLAYLKNRHMAEGDVYPWCENSAKTVLYALFDRPMVCDLWREIEYETMFCKEDVAFYELVKPWRKIELKKLQIGVTLLWQIWWRRNDKVFNGKEVAHMVVAGRARRLVADIGLYSDKIYGYVCVTSGLSSRCGELHLWGS